MNDSWTGIVPFTILSVLFLIAVIVALAWGYGRLSARNRSK